MREIKFRALDLDGNMIYGLPYYSYSTQCWMLSHSDGWVPTYNCPDKGEETILSVVNYKTIEQFTGLYDATPWEKRGDDYQNLSAEDWKGKPIYEGDIFEYRDQYVVVEYAEDMFHCRSTKYPNLSTGNYRLSFVAEGHEIIGNIHENPELLESNE